MDKIFKNLAALMVALGLLTACTEYAATPAATTSADRSKATGIVKANLRDPASGQFRNFATYQTALGTREVCFEYNAKNGFGGMVGFTPASVTFKPDGTHFVRTDLLAQNHCAVMADGAVFG